MARSRLDFDRFIKSKINVEHVYFQPPSTVRMEYPAILYNLADIKNIHADNLHYQHFKAYQLMLITSNPDDPNIDIIAGLPMCQFDRWYAADNLNHYVYTIFY